MANEGMENEFVEALDVRDGKKIWSTRVGNVGNPKMQPSFPAARSTPTVDGDCLYVLSSDGDLACLALSNGSVHWKKNVRSDFGGAPGPWAYAESPLIDGDTLVCAPGGSNATVIALRKTTGDLIWKCPTPEGDEAAFSSAVVADAGGGREYVRLLAKGLVGMDAATGRLLWRYGKPVSKYDANIQTPVVSGDYIYSSATGTGSGVIRLNFHDNRVETEQIYFDARYPISIGGVVKVGDYLYGTTSEALLCAEFATGQIKWKERSIGAASLCVADGRLYLHGENGDVALVDASPESYHERGRFTPPGQPQHPNTMEKSWAYPIVADGRLYIRDHNVLWCYDVRSPKL